MLKTIPKKIEEEINERIRIACKKDKTHTKKLTNHND